MALTIGTGLTIGGGITFEAIFPPAFNVTSGDITYNRQLYGGYSAFSSAGFTCNGTDDTYNGIVYNTTQELHDVILSAWTTAGFDPALTYAWNISFAAGGSIIARVAVNPNNIANSLAISPINQAYPAWQTGQVGTPTQAGTFAFPAAFTPYVPTTSITGSNNWC